MTGAAIGALALLFIPLFGLEQLFLTPPILEGVLAYVVRRSGLRRADTFVAVAGPPLALVILNLLKTNDAAYRELYGHWLIVGPGFTTMLLLAVAVGAGIGARSRTNRHGPGGLSTSQRPGVRAAWVGLVAVVVAGAFVVEALSQPDFIVTRADLEAAAPQMLRAYGTFDGPTRCEGDIVCREPVCRQAQGDTPFAYRSVCYVGKADRFTVMFSNGSGDTYRAERGVFYRPDNISPNLDGVCTIHVFGRWWEFAPIDGSSCPSGFTSYSGE